jgi:NADPH:quinone reductase-like Zn-dependent oxidoreductase
VDYTREDVTTRAERYDVILAVNGNHSMSDYKRVLTRTGVIVVAGGGVRQMLQGSLLSMLRDKKVRGVMARPKQEDLLVLKDLLENGKIVPAIDRKYALADVASAVSYLIEGHSSGKVVITVS